MTGDVVNQNKACHTPESEERGNDSVVPSEVSRIFGKGASALAFEPVRSSTPTRDDSKRNASIGSESCLENEEDSSKKLRLDISPNDKKEIPSDLSPTIEDTGGGDNSLILMEVQEKGLPTETVHQDGEQASNLSLSSREESFDQGDQGTKHGIPGTSQDEGLSSGQSS